jgi:hypothetical protein
MLADKIQTPGNYPEASIQHTEHSKSLKSRMIPYVSTIEDESAAFFQNNGKQSNTMSYITCRI